MRTNGGYSGMLEEIESRLNHVELATEHCVGERNDLELRIDDVTRRLAEVEFQLGYHRATLSLIRDESSSRQTGRWVGDILREREPWLWSIEVET